MGHHHHLHRHDGHDRHEGHPGGCRCGCPAMMSIKEEIRHREEHRQFLQDPPGVIEKKPAALKAALRS